MSRMEFITPPPFNMIKSTISKMDVLCMSKLYAILACERRDLKELEENSFYEYFPAMLDGIEHSLKRGDMYAASQLLELYEKIAYEN